MNDIVEKTNESNMSTFEMSLRILGNEFIGFKIGVDDFRAKWIVLTILASGAFAAIAATFGPMIAPFFK